MPNLQWVVGDVTVTRVEESIHGVPTEQIIPGIEASHRSVTSDWGAPFFTPSGKILLSVHSFVVEAPTATIVVDTCAGTNPPRPLAGDDAFPERLAAAIDGGLDAVDMVLCTHLHFDHVGWNTIEQDEKRVPLFPNARYLVSDREVRHLDVEDHMGVREAAIQPLIDAGVFDIVQPAHRLTPEVRIVPTPGHSAGHVSVVIESAGASAFITGDAIHHPIQVAFPELAASPFDWDSQASTATRREIMARYADQPTLILGTHFAPPTAGHLRTDAAGNHWFDPSPHFLLGRPEV